MFVIACFVSLITALTLLGPAIGSVFGTISNIPPLTGLSCPIGLQPGERGDVVALVSHSDSDPRSYRITFEDFDEAYSPQSTDYCSTIEEIGVGQIATVTCSVERSSDPDQQVMVTANALGDDYSITCEWGCGNIFQSVCEIRGDLPTELARRENQVVIGTELGVGLVLAILGAALWFDAGSIGRAVIVISSTLSIELLAYVFGVIYAHWLPAVMLNVIVAAAVAAYVIWRRRRQKLGTGDRITPQTPAPNP